jgi:hypothetical protein
MDATEAALRISLEIIIQILDLLPLNDLLVAAQRVNRIWRSIILGSPHLQQKLFSLFFTPSDGPPTMNPILEPIFSICFKPPPSWHFIQEFQTPKWERNPDVFLRKESSWRKMLVVNSSMSRLKVFKKWQDDHEIVSEKWCSENTVELESAGLRMGTLYDLTFGFCKEKTNHRLFMVEWRNDVRFRSGIFGDALNEYWRGYRYYGKDRSKDREVVEVCLRASNYPDRDEWGMKKEADKEQKTELLNMF